MNGKTAMLVIFLILLGIAGGYYIGANYKLTFEPQNAVTITAPTPEPQNTVIPTLQASPSGQAIDETAALISAVKAGLVAEHGSGASAMTVTVSKIVGNFAQGGAKEPEAVGGGMWLAAKVGGAWKLLWDGNGTISCESVDPYNFPNTMVPECWNEGTGTLITR